MTGDLGDALQRGWGLSLLAVDDVVDSWLSGKRVAKLTTDAGIRRLAAHTTQDPSHLDRAIDHQARLAEAGCPAIPAVHRTRSGGLLLDVAGTRYELTDWAPGEPELDRSAWTLPMLEALGRAVGEIHEAGSSWVTGGLGVPPESYWTGDWRSFGAWAESSWRELADDPEVRAAPALGPTREVIATALVAVAALPTPGEGRRTVTHDDLWTAHVLWDEGRLSAIIDLDGLDIGDPLGDLAALLSDFADLDPERCGAIVRGYRLVCPVSRDDLATALHTVIRHHLLVLIERVRLWLQHPARRDALIEPTDFWLASLPAAIGLDARQWAASVDLASGSHTS